MIGKARLDDWQKGYFPNFFEQHVFIGLATALTRNLHFGETTSITNRRVPPTRVQDQWGGRKLQGTMPEAIADIPIMRLRIAHPNAN
jgi:hypothetical protein